MTSFADDLDNWTRGVTRARLVYQLETSCPECGGWREPRSRIGCCPRCRDLRTKRKKATR